MIYAEVNDEFTKSNSFFAGTNTSGAYMTGIAGRMNRLVCQWEDEEDEEDDY